MTPTYPPTAALLVSIILLTLTGPGAANAGLDGAAARDLGKGHGRPPAAPVRIDTALPSPAASGAAASPASGTALVRPSPRPPSEKDLLGRIEALFDEKSRDPQKTRQVVRELLATFMTYVRLYPNGSMAPKVAGGLINMLLMGGQSREAESVALDYFKKSRQPRTGLMVSEMIGSYHLRNNRPERAVAFVDTVLRAREGHPLAFRIEMFIPEVLILAHRGAGAIDRLEKMSKRKLDTEEGLWVSQMMGRACLEVARHSREKEATELRRKALEFEKTVIERCPTDPLSLASVCSAAFLTAVEILLSHRDRDGAMKYYEQMMRVLRDTDEVALAERGIKDLALIGSKARPIQGPGLDGRPVRLDQFKGKVVLLDFWATWCMPCLQEIPNVVRLSQRMKGRPLAIVSVSLDRKGQGERLKAFVAKNEMRWDHVYDGLAWESPIVKAYDVTGIPAMFLIDDSGTIRRTALRGAELEHAIDEELARVEPAGPAPRRPATKGKGD